MRARAAMEERREALYLTLGVSPGASVSTLKRAYRRAAKRCHPDVCSDVDAIERFLDVQNAYEELLAESGSLQTVGQAEWRHKWRKQVCGAPSPRYLRLYTAPPSRALDMSSLPYVEISWSLLTASSSRGASRFFLDAPRRSLLTDGAVDAFVCARRQVENLRSHAQEREEDREDREEAQRGTLWLCTTSSMRVTNRVVLSRHTGRGWTEPAVVALWLGDAPRCTSVRADRRRDDVCFVLIRV